MIFKDFCSTCLRNIESSREARKWIWISCPFSVFTPENSHFFFFFFLFFHFFFCQARDCRLQAATLQSCIMNEMCHLEKISHSFHFKTPYKSIVLAEFSGWAGCCAWTKALSQHTSDTRSCQGQAVCLGLQQENYQPPKAGSGSAGGGEARLVLMGRTEKGQKMCFLPWVLPELAFY